MAAGISHAVPLGTRSASDERHSKLVSLRTANDFQILQAIVHLIVWMSGRFFRTLEVSG